MSKFIRVADQAAMVATLSSLQAEGFSFDAVATNDAGNTAKRPQIIAYKESQTINVLFNEMSEGVSFYGRRAAVEARDFALSLIAEIKPAAAVDTVTNRIARVKAEMRELAEYEAAIPAAAEAVEPTAAAEIEPTATAEAVELQRAPYATKAEAVAAIKAAGFEMEPNDSGNGDKFETVTAGAHPGLYNHYARPVFDPGAGHWVILIDVNRFADLPAVAEEMAAAAVEPADQGANLAAALLHVEALQEEAATLDTIDSVWLAIMETFKKMNIAFDDVERLKSESGKSGSRLNVLFRMVRIYRRSEEAAAGFGYIGVGCISFAQGRLAVFKRRAVRLVARRLAG